MLLLAVLAEAFAVIGNDHDRAVAERFCETADLLVHRGDFAEVWLLREA